MKPEYPFLLLFPVMLFIVYNFYAPGIHGVFILDDIPNLSPLGKNAHLGGWHDFQLFLLEGFSGALGRPVSLASFYIDDHAWPSWPSGFKYTNILLHLLNGILVFWLLYLITALIGLPKKQVYSITLLTTVFWLIHPLQASTVLYVVQRMTELAALFTLAGLILYCKGRRLLFEKPSTGFWLLTTGGGIALLLAVLSKENGALLVGYVLVLEFFLLRPMGVSVPAKLNHWLAVFIFLPFILLAGYLLRMLYYDIQATTTVHPFSMLQRLLTESRVLFDYLFQILLPRLESLGLFHDHYVVSTSWHQPWTTFTSIMGIIVLILLALYTRKRLPVLAFAIAWFFCGHLLESTVIPLEIYFEHRNYLPMLGVLLAVVYFVHKGLENHQSLKTVISAAFFAYITLIVFVSYQNISLWAAPEEMIRYWSDHNPDSIRAREALIAIKGSDKQVLELPWNDSRTKSSYVIFFKLSNACMQSDLVDNDLREASDQLNDTDYIRATPQLLENFIIAWMNNACPGVSAEKLTSFLERIPRIQNLQHTKMLHSAYYWLGRVYAKQRNLNMTMHYLQKSFEQSPRLDILLLQAQYLSSAGLYDAAIKQLQQDCGDVRNCLIWKIRAPEVERMKNQILVLKRKSGLRAGS